VTVPDNVARGPRRVLLVEASGDCHGGAQMMLDELIRRLDPARYFGVFAGLRDGSWPQRLRREGFPVYVVPKTRWRDVRSVAGVARGLAEVVRGERIDLVHANGGESLLFASLGARQGGVPVVWDVYDPLTGLSPRKLLTARRHVTARILAMLHPDAIIFGTGRAAEGVPRRRSTPTATILPGIDLDRYGHGNGRRARAELGISDDAPLLAMFGRLTFLKSQTDFVRAMADVVRAVPGARGVICGGEGDSAYAARVRALRSEMGLEEAVLLTGFLPDELKDDLVAAADIVVHLARRESFGLAVLEAQAAGKAVVAADASGPRSLIEDGSTGILVPVGDVGRLTDVLIGLLEDPGRRIELGSQAKEASRRHPVEAMVERIQDVWDRVPSVQSSKE
jgi:glycosyltransferase involved in cell wall biosynthesis